MKIKNSSSFALISYISRCYHDGDKAALDVLNIDPGQARRISRLSAFESNTLSGIAGRFTVFRLQFRSLEKCYRLVVEDPVSLSGSRSKTKEVDLCLHVFNHIITLYRRSEQQALAEIGLEPEQAEFISLRPWVELQKLARFHYRRDRQQALGAVDRYGDRFCPLDRPVRGTDSRRRAAGSDDALLRHELRVVCGGTRDARPAVPWAPPDPVGRLAIPSVRGVRAPLPEL